MMVERMVGFNLGAGGTMGADDLASLRSGSFFPERLSVRTKL